MKILVTGGAGFIGSALVRHLVSSTSHHVINIDKLTYSGHLESLAPIAQRPNYHFEKGDIVDRAEMVRIFREQKPDYVFHLAAESHVDRSIDGPSAFIQTNIVGTSVLLETALEYWKTLSAERKAAFRFQHISTDEVFGSLEKEDPAFTEQSVYQPNSPYSASKAASDHLVRAWHHTFGLPVVTTNCSNNYGPYQFPEKLIPLAIQKACRGETIPIYGKGENIRDWLYVEDHVDAILLVMQKGRTGETYNVGGGAEKTNLELIGELCDIIDRELKPSKPVRSLIGFVTDRPAHDKRYAIDFSKLSRELGWRPRENLSTGLEKTVKWYLQNQKWSEAVMSQRYDGKRLGVL